jgi:hypothetical protein
MFVLSVHVCVPVFLGSWFRIQAMLLGLLNVYWKKKRRRKLCKTAWMQRRMEFLRKKTGQ